MPELSDEEKIALGSANVQQWTRVEGLRVCYQRVGLGPALVLVHGLLGYSFSWRFALPLLANGREVFALDMPGSGFSDCDPALDCRLNAAARRLLSFLDAVGISSCDLVGSSYGGTTAAMAAALAPQRVRTLTLVSPANPWSRIGRHRLAFFGIPAVAAFFPPIARPLRALHGFFVHRMYGDARRIAPDTIRGYSLPLARPGNLEHAVQIVRTWDSDMREFQTALPKIVEIPTLLVWGSKDRVVDPRSAADLSRHFHQVETAVIDGAGHLPYEECPEEFSRALVKFLDAHSPAVPHGK